MSSAGHKTDPLVSSLNNWEQQQAGQTLGLYRDQMVGSPLPYQSTCSHHPFQWEHPSQPPLHGLSLCSTCPSGSAPASPAVLSRPLVWALRPLHGCSPAASFPLIPGRAKPSPAQHSSAGKPPFLLDPREDFSQAVTMLCHRLLTSPRGSLVSGMGNLHL